MFIKSLSIKLINPLMKYYHLKIEFNKQTPIVKTPILLPIISQLAGNSRVSNTTVNNDGLFKPSHFSIIKAI
ncbi:MAG: hypothetical protein U0T83_08240 [Bacteriovoracaceae bacterium]